MNSKKSRCAGHAADFGIMSFLVLVSRRLFMSIIFFSLWRVGENSSVTAYTVIIQFCPSETEVSDLGSSARSNGSHGHSGCSE